MNPKTTRAVAKVLLEILLVVALVVTSFPLYSSGRGDPAVCLRSFFGQSRMEPGAFATSGFS